MALTPNFAASVTIADLPTGTTVTGAELFEAVQTGSGGFARSVQLTLNQMRGGIGSLIVGTSLATTSDSFGNIVGYVANNGIGTAQLATSVGLTGSLSVGSTLNVTGTATLAVGPVISNFGSGFLQASSTGVVTSSGLVVMTAAQYRADTASKILSTDTTWGAAASVLLTDAATVSMDFSTFINATLTGTGGVGSTRTLGAATNVKIGQSGVIEWFPVTGGTTLVVPTSSSYVSAGGISTLSLSTTNGAQDAIIYTVLSTNKVLLAIQKAVAT